MLIGGCETKVGSNSNRTSTQEVKIIRELLENMHQQFNRAVNSADQNQFRDKVNEIIQDNFQEIIKLDVIKISTLEALSATRKALLVTTRYGTPSEFAIYFCLELLRRGIASDRMALVDKTEMPSANLALKIRNFKTQRLKRAVHCYVRVRISNNTLLVVDPYFNILCQENNYFFLPQIKKIIKYYFSPTDASGEIIQTYNTDDFHHSKLNEIDKLTETLIENSKHKVEKLRKTSSYPGFFNKRVLTTTGAIIGAFCTSGIGGLLAGAAFGFALKPISQTVAASCCGKSNRM